MTWLEAIPFYVLAWLAIGFVLENIEYYLFFSDDNWASGIDQQVMMTIFWPILAIYRVIKLLVFVVERFFTAKAIRIFGKRGKE
jgi:hypothetical protein